MVEADDTFIDSLFMAHVHMNMAKTTKRGNFWPEDEAGGRKTSFRPCERHCKAMDMYLEAMCICIFVRRIGASKPVND